MKNAFSFFVALLCLFLSSCHRPVAYFQRTPHAAARLSDQSLVIPVDEFEEDSVLNSIPAEQTATASNEVVIASLSTPPTRTAEANAHIERRMHRIQTMLQQTSESIDKQPKPKPKNQLRLGNRIRQGLGIPLRQELNWWQRISWKLKASVIIILVAVLFAILHVTILAIIFGIVGAFLLISGLKKSFKVRRPWF